MEAKDNRRTIRSLFEMGEMRPGAPGAAPRRPGPGPTENATPGLKTLSLSDRQLTLTIGALEHVLEDLQRLPGTETVRKDLENVLFVMRQSQAALPPPKAP